MIRVAQFGEGNFLRAFADVYFDTLNKEGNDYRVTIVKPTARGNLDKFTKQNNRYHVVLRGVRDGQAAEDAYRIDCLDDAIDPHSDFEAFLALARFKQNRIDFDAATLDCDGLLSLLLKTANGEYKCKSEDVREIAFFKTGVTL